MHNPSLDPSFAHLENLPSVNPGNLSKFVKMFVPLGQQTALPLRLCKSSWNEKEFARFYPHQWISGYYHFFLNGGCGPTYIHGRGLGILFKKLWIFQRREISFKAPVTPSADSNSRYRYIIGTRFSFPFFLIPHFPHFGETACPFPPDGAGFVVLAIIVASWGHFARPCLFTPLGGFPFSIHPITRWPSQPLILQPSSTRRRRWSICQGFWKSSQLDLLVGFSFSQLATLCQPLRLTFCSNCMILFAEFVIPEKKHWIRQKGYGEDSSPRKKLRHKLGSTSTAWRRS